MSGQIRQTGNVLHPDLLKASEAISKSAGRLEQIASQDWDFFKRSKALMTLNKATPVLQELSRLSTSCGWKGPESHHGVGSEQFSEAWKASQGLWDALIGTYVESLSRQLERVAHTFTVGSLLTNLVLTGDQSLSPARLDATIIQATTGQGRELGTAMWAISKDTAWHERATSILRQIQDLPPAQSSYEWTKFTMGLADGIAQNAVPKNVSLKNTALGFKAWSKRK